MRPALLHLGVLAALVAAGFLLPAYPHGMLARILVMAVFAMGYNIAFGYTGLLSLGHALHFCAGMMATGLAMRHGITAGPALLLGLAAGAATATLTGLLALRTAGVSFMIVTLMFAQAGYLTLLYFGATTGGDEGFNLSAAGRVVLGLDLSQDGPRYLMALALSGLYCGAAGAAYGLLFGYVGASFGTSQYSILPLLYVLLGGAGTTLGPLLGAGVMAWLIDAASSLTDSPLAVIGITLIVLVLFAPKGILGTLREKGLKWLP